MKMDKVELSGLIVLFVGVGLLAFTFLSAYTFLVGSLSILGSQNLVQVFGQALAPLIEAVIRILYLGVMGWLGSILTIRAVQLLKRERIEVAPMLQPVARAETKQTTKQEPKPEVKEIKTEVEKPKNVEETGKIETPEKPETIEKPEEEALAPPPPAS